MARKSKVEHMVKAETLMAYLHNLAKDGTGYVIHFYPKEGHAIIDHNFAEASKAYQREVSVDLMNTAREIMGD